jgi:regulator of protease activity HflC (stomatin/prohibitin superfamily)
MRNYIFVSFLALSGCSSLIEPGHRGLLFNPRRGGLQHEVLSPGYHWVGAWGRVDDFDVTYSTRKEDIHTTSAEGLGLDLRLAVIFRPIVEELYQLDTEIGANYYDEVVGPEFRTAARGVFARHSYTELQKLNEKIEDEVEAELRRRIAGKHIEISSVTMEQLDYAPEIATAIREKLVGEQEAVRKKVQLENDALRERLTAEHEAEQAKVALQHEAEQAKLKAEGTLRARQAEHRLVEEQAAIDKLRADTEAQTRVTKARAEAEERTLLAKAHEAEKRAEAVAVTPLSVMMHAYDSLGKLGGDGTTILLGDFAHVPNFLFPHSGIFQNLWPTTPLPSAPSSPSSLNTSARR